MKTGPRTWTLVVPIDPTRPWFDSLGVDLPAQLEWLGKIWIEGGWRFPEIIRYFSGGR